VGERNIKKAEKKKKKVEIKTSNTTELKTMVAQPEVIKKKKKDL